MSTLTLENNTLVVNTPYNPALVAEIKMLPYTERKWDPTRRVWLVAPQHGQAVAAWIGRYLNEMVLVPQAAAKTPTPETRILDVRYIGVTKERTPGNWSAFGYSNGSWSVSFPESVLRGWFELMPQQVSGKPTLYGLLGIGQTANADELKSAFRRMARQWHPDTCREPNAAEMFMHIKDAYDILSDGKKRARYDAGLALEAMAGKSSTDAKLASQAGLGYRSPLRCGLILAEGVESLACFEAAKILQWEDVINAAGQTLVTSWPKGADRFVEVWN
ncbi:MAG: J domain-containing protein [Chloroflexota bacterium]